MYIPILRYFLFLNTSMMLILKQIKHIYTFVVVNYTKTLFFTQALDSWIHGPFLRVKFLQQQAVHSTTHYHHRKLIHGLVSLRRVGSQEMVGREGQLNGLSFLPSSSGTVRQTPRFHLRVFRRARGQFRWLEEYNLFGRRRRQDGVEGL